MTESVSTRVVWAVAAEKGVDPTDLPLLNDVVDTDALEVLFGPKGNGEGREHPPCEIRFSYAGRTVCIRDGDITVDCPDVSSTSMADD